ncbi:L-ascorbate metabolism protein UlaG (beta-lactamase superfamily) [Flavobacterium araucananum]|uniref:Polyketide synthase n=1 Tax=Flavobacterium araucananum TaxID=946678 RepID=A0A227PHX4_9FLAO|nr:MBL fold metallo-hydrolase [Flavobacterium araucananum]OXG09143.1 polyketide synthase [Flavobacterium araucananum]PWJ99660.1 L-ascorbate metabolism protein UlaG (beta-lactamase superfamily) [Flavobacterium araucananum]
MENEVKHYLKLNVAIEALIDRWYAWSHLVSPATAAMNIKERHLKIMQSYIKNPKTHAAAVKKPEMLGGPFIDYNGERVDEISELYEQTLVKRENMLLLYDAVHELNTMLQKNAIGYSLNPLYKEVPDSLKGLVELYYDLNNKPNFRFFEHLLYKTEFYDEATQSISLQLISADDSRSFVLSTPRLDDEHLIHLDLEFKNGLIDELFKMKRVPGDAKSILKKLGIKPEQEGLFESFFTTEAPKKYQKYEGDGIRTRYFGHACVLVETKDISILVDPVISYDGYETDVNRYTINDLPEQIDYVLITHNHQDHILLETLLQLRHSIKNIIVPSSGKGDLQDPNLKLMFNAIGFNNVIELNDMESIQLDKCEITGIPFLGEHSDIDIRSKLCYHVSLHNDFKVMFVADSCNIEPIIYERIHAVIGAVDVIFLGMECDGAPLSWLYGPLMFDKLPREMDQSRRLAGCDFTQGVNLIDIFKPKNVFVYAMGLEPWLEFISSIKYTDESRPIIESNKLVDYCRERGVEAERLFGEKTIEY